MQGNISKSTLKGLKYIIINDFTIKKFHFSPSSSVVNDSIISSPKPCLFPAATDILYVVYGVRLFNVSVFFISVVLFQMRDFSSVSLIKNPLRLPFPVFCGASQVITAFLDVISVTERLVGLSGNRALEKQKSKLRYCFYLLIPNETCNREINSSSTYWHHKSQFSHMVLLYPILE